MEKLFPARVMALLDFGMRSYLLLSVALAGTALAQPVVTSGGIANASGYQATLAPDTVFVIFGSGLGPATLATASAPNYPTSVGGTSITFTPAAGGAAINAKMVYSTASQIAGLLPSTIAPGTYAVTVTYNNQTSNPQNVTVAARSFGIAASNSAGTGAAQATIGNVNGGVSLVRMTGGSVSFNGLTWTLAPAHPGDELVLWGTGGGADPKNDTGGTSGDQTAAGNFSVSVDGTAITPLYSGAASGYPGLWQINFVLPKTIAADCFAYVQVTAGGQLSNGVTIAIAGTGANSCASTIPDATLSKLDSGTGTVTMAGLNIGQLVGSGGSVGGVINHYTVSEFLIPFSGPKFGPCNVLDETYPVGGKEPSAPDSILDAGTLTISGPGGSMQTVTKISQPLGPVYNSSLSPVDGGFYTLTASGGSQVGPFSVTTTFPTGFTVPNFSSFSTINRSQPLTVNWSGSGFDLVKIMIIDDVETAATVHGVAVECSVPASLGTYTVPAAALAYLPANSASFQVIALVTNGAGAQSAESTTEPNTLIPLVSGGLVDFGGFGAYIDYYESTTVQ